METRMTAGSFATPMSVSVSALSQETFSRLAQLGLMTVAAAALRVGDRLQTWRQRAESRRALARLCERGRWDLGVTPSDVHTELRKQFWQI